MAIFRIAFDISSLLRASSRASWQIRRASSAASRRISRASTAASVRTLFDYWNSSSRSSIFRSSRLCFLSLSTELSCSAFFARTLISMESSVSFCLTGSPSGVARMTSFLLALGVTLPFDNAKSCAADRATTPSFASRSRSV